MFRHMVCVIVALTLVAVAGCPSALDGAPAPNTNSANGNANAGMNANINMNAGGGQVTMFTASLDADQATPQTTSLATGSGTAMLDAGEMTLTFDFMADSLVRQVTAAEFRIGQPGVAGPLLLNVTSFLTEDDEGVLVIVRGSVRLTQEQVTSLLEDDVYIALITATYPNGIIRGQLAIQ